MKKFLAMVLAILSATGAQAEQPTNPNQSSSAAAAFRPKLTEGLVKNVDRISNKITLKHGPLSDGMPGMTMTFKVKDPGSLKGLKDGQKVLFSIDEAMLIVWLEQTN